MTILFRDFQFQKNGFDIAVVRIDRKDFPKLPPNIIFIGTEEPILPRPPEAPRWYSERG